MLKWISVGILCFVNIVHFMDRFTVSGVLSNIKEEFNLTFWQCGLLQTVFLIGYCIFAPLFGYLGDRYSRKKIMILSIIFWGISTFVASLAKNYSSLLISRTMIGCGEAGFSTIAPTVLGDLFFGNARTAVLAVFYFAIPVGSGLGYIAGEKVGQLANDWRWGLRVTPILIVISIVIMILFLLDPVRGEREPVKPTKSVSNSTLLKDVKYLLKNKSYVFVTAAYTFLTFATGALTWWGPLLIENGLKVRKEYGLDTSSDPQEKDVAFLFGIVMVVAGILGLLLGSSLSLKFRKKYPRIDPIICGMGLLLSSPFFLVAISRCLDSVNRAYALIFVAQTFLNMNWAITVDISMYVVIPTVRSTAEGIQLMVTHAFGEAVSPYLIGALTDAFLQIKNEPVNSNPNGTVPMSEVEKSFYALQSSMYITVVFCILSGISFMISSLFVVKDKSKVAKKLSEDVEIPDKLFTRIED